MTATLQRHYRDPLLAARTAHGQGQGVVGLVGVTIPVELVLATGRLPVLITPNMGAPTPTADIYIEPVVPPETRALFEDALAGTFEFLDLLVLSRTDDKLYYYLKEMVRLGRAPKAPRLHMFDLMPSQREAVRKYNRDNFDDLIAELERVTGREITDAALREAITLTNRRRALQRRLMEVRSASRVAGSDAMQAIGAGYFMPPAAYADALEAYLGELDAGPSPAAQSPRLLVATSEPLSYLDLHTRIEAAGGFIVAEDDSWGARAPGGDIPLDRAPREAVFNKYWQDTAHGGVYPAEAREAWFKAQAARDDVDGVVFYVPPSDHQFGWDYPRLAAHVAGLGKPSVLLRQDATRDDAIDGKIAAFVAEVGGGR
ncbi:MAG: 2-hydroxyacyl-CoA dehydratase family protein [Caulobacteraceae bacterium]